MTHRKNEEWGEKSHIHTNCSGVAKEIKVERTKRPHPNEGVPLGGERKGYSASIGRKRVPKRTKRIAKKKGVLPTRVCKKYVTPSGRELKNTSLEHAEEGGASGKGKPHLIDLDQKKEAQGRTLSAGSELGRLRRRVTSGIRVLLTARGKKRR